MNKRKIYLPEAGLRELYLVQGLSQLKVAQHFGCSQDTVERHLKEYAIPIRTWAQAALNRFGVLDLLKDFSGDPYEKAYLIGFRIGDLSVWKYTPKSEAVIVDTGTTRPEQVALLKALFEAYGRVRVKEYRNKFLQMQSDPYGDFSIPTTDKQILEQCHQKLLDMGIRCSHFRLKRPAGFISKLGWTARKDVWEFHVAERDSLLRLIDLLTPYCKHPQRVADMFEVRENVAHRISTFGGGRRRSKKPFVK